MWLNDFYKFKPSFATRNVTSTNIVDWMQDLKEEKLTPYWKSARPPYDNDNAVRILTGNTFVEEVSKPDKELIVWFNDYTKPEMLYWRAKMFEVAEHYENVTDVVFAELDQADNEPEGIIFDKLPQIFYYKKGEDKGQPV